jgi:hypothetical protein
MIRRDDSNSRWWGADVARVTDPAFVTLGAEERAAALAPYAWAELRAPLDAAPDPWSLCEAGFGFCDVQIGFRIRLGPPSSGSSAERLEVVDAADAPFDPAGLPVRAFVHERFLLLRGATPERVGERYLAWARQLASEHPTLALHVLRDGEPQGWFCARPAERGIELTLAALYEDATTSGMHLYEAALGAFAARGHRIGGASFSITNTDVHGIYAALGARFVSTDGSWIWQAST